MSPTHQEGADWRGESEAATKTMGAKAEMMEIGRTMIVAAMETSGMRDKKEQRDAGEKEEKDSKKSSSRQRRTKGLRGNNGQSRYGRLRVMASSSELLRKVHLLRFEPWPSSPKMKSGR